MFEPDFMILDILEISEYFCLDGFLRLRNRSPTEFLPDAVLQQFGLQPSTDQKGKQGLR